MTLKISSFWKIYRLIFTLFALYIMGDAFNRWDGVKYYASFLEFLPSISLLTLLLSILAFFIALSIWLLANFFLMTKLNIMAEHILTFAGCSVVVTALVYSGKLLFKTIQMTYQLKFSLLILVFLLSFLVTWLLRKKSVQLIDNINEHISPLVWIFGTFVILSVPLIVYHTWEKRFDNPLSKQTRYPTESGRNRPNILLITFDAMTALDMSAYGYRRPTTPYIDKWAQSASLFSNIKAESNYTTPTTASLMTGKRVWSHQTYFVEVASDIASENNENLPYLLKNSGYSNMALQQIHRASVRKLGIAENFDIIFGPDHFSYSTNLYKYTDKLLYTAFGEKIILYDWIIKEDFIFFKVLNKVLHDSSVTTQPPENAFNKALELIDHDLPEPFFAWIHLFAPHDPYLPPSPFMGMFDPSPDLRTWKTQMRGNRIKQIDLYRARYDEFIRYADKQLESFMKEFEKRNAFKKTVIILSADHGESFEHNYKGHGGPHLFEQLTNIPLIIKSPDQLEGKVIDSLAEQIDITPTILELVDIPVPSWMEGRSLVPLLSGKTLLPRPAFSMNLEENPGRNHQITKGTVAVWEGNYKLIHYLENEKSLLFNLADDPGEKNNIFNKEHVTGNRLLTLIKNNLAKVNHKIKTRKSHP